MYKTLMRLENLYIIVLIKGLCSKRVPCWAIAKIANLKTADN